MTDDAPMLGGVGRDNTACQQSVRIPFADVIAAQIPI